MPNHCRHCGDTTHTSEQCASNPERVAQGARYNTGKMRPDLIPPQVLIELAEHYAYGANKYNPNNWMKGFPYSETYASLTRHLFAWWAGERNDPESGRHHLVAVIWNAVTLLYFELFPAKYATFDDRPFAKKYETDILELDLSKNLPVKPEFQIDANPRTSVPIPEGYMLVGPFAVIKENDKSWIDGKWQTVPKTPAYTGSARHIPIIRAVYPAHRPCPLCNVIVLDEFERTNSSHEKGCPVQQVSDPRRIRTPGERIKQGDIWIDNNGLFNPLYHDNPLIGLFVAGRPIIKGEHNE